MFRGFRNFAKGGRLVTPEEKYAKLTQENKEEVIRQIEILIASQSEHLSRPGSQD